MSHPAVAKQPVLCERQRSVSIAPNTAEGRLHGIVVDHFDAVWCFLRRLGLSGADVDDAAQDVMTVAATKLAHIEHGSERSFLFGTAYRVALKSRRTRARQPQGDEEAVDGFEDPCPSQEELTDQHHARELLDRVLDSLPLDVRAVFVLAEIDELGAPAIAALLDIPQGTVASRLRRGRKLFDERLARVHARMQTSGGPR